MMNRSKTVALGGIMLALSMVTLYAEAVFPVWKLSLYALSSFYGAIMIIESGVMAGWLFYGASVMLGLILVPDKLSMLPYAMCFGLYALVKYYVERLSKRPLEIGLKLIFFNGAFAALFYLAKEVLFGGSSMAELPVAVLFVILQAVFLIYDYALSCMIKYYVRRRR